MGWDRAPAQWVGVFPCGDENVLKFGSDDTVNILTESDTLEWSQMVNFMSYASHLKF